MAKPTGNPTGRPKVDISGKRFGRLVVLHPCGSKGHSALWLCLCDCGMHTEVPGPQLRSGNTKSCGCYKKDVQEIHGEHRSPEYKVWSAMIDRTTNPNHEYFHHYGGRGIAVCDRWKTSLALFIEDMGRRPSKGYSLDRIDNNGHYEPENCRWANWKEQQRNRRNNRYLTYNGETRCMSDWAEHLGIGKSVLHARLRKGWNVEKVLTTPVAKRTRREKKQESK